jgi:tetratricopeptide (TPR) repeat protein
VRRYAAVASLAVGLLFQAESACGQQAARPELAVAESALARGDFDRAVDLARAYTYHHADDWRGWLIQGRATLARGGASNAYRVPAIIAFRRATRLAPERVEAWDGYGRAGLELGDADGEAIVREAFERVLALDPLYPGAWESWLKAYRGGSDRERMRRILARHDSISAVRARIAQLLIEDERYPAADEVLDSLLAVDPDNAGWLALRAQSALESGDTRLGLTLYDRALAHAGRNGGEVLWQEAIGIATAGEIRAWEASIPPSARSGFLRAFWARRNPNLFKGFNLRVAEHFARLRVARKEFPSTFPLAGYKIRALQRTLGARPTGAENLFYQRCEARESPSGPTRAADAARMTPEIESLLYDPSIEASWRNPVLPPGELYVDPKVAAVLDMPYARDLRDVDTTAAAIGYNLRTGLDDRGLTFLRFGAPRRRIVGSLNEVDPFCQLRDLERWEYDDIGTVRFFRPEALSLGAAAASTSTGELVFRPMSERQFEAMEAVLTRNATSVPAPLSFGLWLAQFAGAAPETTDLVVVTTRGGVAAQLTAASALAGSPRGSATGVVVLDAAPGWYSLLVNAEVGDTLGRQGLTVFLHALGRDSSVSDFLLAPAWPDTVITQGAMLGRVQRDLIFGTGATLRAYAEIYGLRPVDGRVDYRASYQIFRSGDLAQDARREDLRGGVRLSFMRSRPSVGGPVAEWLDITPEQVPPGRYLLRLEVTEPRGVQVIGRAQIAFEIRSR